MPGSALLDTSAAVAFLRGDQGLVDRLAQLDDVYTSAVVLGELLYGARHSAKRTQNLEKVTEFSLSIVVLPCDDQTAPAYARLKQGLRERGLPIPDNDLWIAATAVQHDLVLICDDAHFATLDELRRESW